MNKTFLYSLLILIGFVSPVKAEPEWVKYKSSKSTPAKTDYYIDKNILITNDGINIFATRSINYISSDPFLKRASWNGVNCDKRVFIRSSGSSSPDFSLQIPDRSKMSTRELKELTEWYDLESQEKKYNIACKGEKTTYINYKAIDILDSQHPYKESIDQSELNKLGLTYNQYQSLIIQHEKSKNNFKWKRTGYKGFKDKWNQLYLPLTSINKPKDNININNKTISYLDFAQKNIGNYNQKEINKLRKRCLDIADNMSDGYRERRIISCNNEFPSEKANRSNNSNNESARNKCLQAKDYAGCMEYEMSN